MGVTDHRHEQPAVGLGRETQMDIRQADNLITLHCGVELRILSNPATVILARSASTPTLWSG